MTTNTFAQMAITFFALRLIEMTDRWIHYANTDKKFPRNFDSPMTFHVKADQVDESKARSHIILCLHEKKHLCEKFFQSLKYLPNMKPNGKTITCKRHRPNPTENFDRVCFDGEFGATGLIVTEQRLLFSYTIS